MGVGPARLGKRVNGERTKKTGDGTNDEGAGGCAGVAPAASANYLLSFSFVVRGPAHTKSAMAGNSCALSGLSRTYAGRDRGGSRHIHALRHSSKCGVTFFRRTTVKGRRVNDGPGGTNFPWPLAGTGPLHAGGSGVLRPPCRRPTGAQGREGDQKRAPPLDV